MLFNIEIDLSTLHRGPTYLSSLTETSDGYRITVAIASMESQAELSSLLGRHLNDCADQIAAIAFGTKSQSS